MIYSNSTLDAAMDTEDITMVTNNQTLQPIIQVDKMLMMKKKNAASRPQHIVSQAEEELNPQLNQQLKKQLKAQQKKARRQADGTTTSNNLIDEDDDMMMQEEITPSAFQFNSISAPIIDEDEEL
jgi:hypothetical protein